MFQFDKWVRKSCSVTAVFLILAWAQASALADEILVSAAASLTDVLKEISNGYQSKCKNTVNFNFGPSSDSGPADRRGRACGYFLLGRCGANG